MIIIANRRKRGVVGEYCGRPSPLGNPFTLHDERNDAERNRVCDLYERWFADQLEARAHRFIEELKRLRAILFATGTITLVCWCYPKRCHTQTIARWLAANA